MVFFVDKETVLRAEHRRNPPQQSRLCQIATYINREVGRSTLSSLDFRKDDALIQRINPPGLHQTPGYHHVTVADATTMVFLAGQCPLDEGGQLVGTDDLRPQVEQVIRNIVTALSSVGATPDDVVRTVIYVVSTNRDDLSLVWTMLRNSAIAPALSTASTLLGVSQLGYSGQLVEIDVTALSSSI